MSGIGKGTFPSGRSYLGEFKESKPHGKGIRNLPDGTRQKGWFAQGEFIFSYDFDEAIIQ